MMKYPILRVSKPRLGQTKEAARNKEINKEKKERKERKKRSKQGDGKKGGKKRKRLVEVYQLRIVSPPTPP